MSSKAETSSGAHEAVILKRIQITSCYVKFKSISICRKVNSSSSCPTWPPPAVPKSSSYRSILPPSFLQRNSQLSEIFCPSAQEQLECHSLSVHIHIHVCLCSSIRVWVLITHSCFYWVHTTGLCVCIGWTCLHDSWGCRTTRAHWCCCVLIVPSRVTL